MGTAAAAKHVEETPLSQGGEGSAPDSADAGEGQFASTNLKEQVVREATCQDQSRQTSYSA